MRHHLSVLAVCALAACSGGTSTSTMGSSTGPGTPSTPVVPTPPATQNFASLLNNARAGNGAGAVSFDARLGRAAQAHANDMLANNYFSHTGLNNSSPGDRIAAQGYDWSTYGENIARGQQTEADVFRAWQNSSGHRRNNLNPNFEDFGLAKAGTGSNKYWVLVLATEAR